MPADPSCRDQPVARGNAQLGQEALAQRTARQADLARHLGKRWRRVGIGPVKVDVASALSVVAFVIVLVIVAIYVRVVRPMREV